MPIRLIDVEGYKKFYDGENPMHINESLLDHFTNAWIHISAADVLTILNSSVGMSHYMYDDGISIKKIGYNDLHIVNVIIPLNNKDNYLDYIHSIYKRSMAILGYYQRNRETGTLEPINQINIGSYEDWCYIMDNRMTGDDIIDHHYSDLYNE